MLEHHLQQNFFDCADLVYSSAEALAKPLADATQALVGSITAGGKILSFGESECGLMAQYACSTLLGRFERDRPSLAAMTLPVDGSDLWLRQLEAMGQPGDVLLAWATGQTPSNLLLALASAHEKDMTVVVISGCHVVLKDKLTETDVHVIIPHERNARVHEVQWLILHSLCDAIDLQLLGEDHL